MSETADSVVVYCSQCGKKNRAPCSAAGKRGKCSACGAVILIPSEVTPTANADAQAMCAAHPSNIATAKCDRCSAPICSLCAVSAGSSTLCPKCFDSATTPKPRRHALFNQEFSPIHYVFALVFFFLLTFTPFLWALGFGVFWILAGIYEKVGLQARQTQEQARGKSVLCVECGKYFEGQPNFCPHCGKATRFSGPK